MTNDEFRSGRDITDLNAATEEIFQLHKRHIIVKWTEDTSPTIDPAIRVQAVNLLEDQKIIFKPNPSDSSTTQINPIVTSASSYEDALSIIEEKGQRSSLKITPVIKEGSQVDILEPPKPKRTKALWIIIAIVIALFLLFNFVPFYKWL